MAWSPPSYSRKADTPKPRESGIAKETRAYSHAIRKRRIGPDPAPRTLAPLFLIPIEDMDCKSLLAMKVCVAPDPVIHADKDKRRIERHGAERTRRETGKSVVRIEHGQDRDAGRESAENFAKPALVEVIPAGRDGRNVTRVAHR